MTTAAPTFRDSVTASSNPLVVVRELTKSFVHMGTRLDVLKGINLRIDEGEVVSIVGKSGAGKSTLLHCIGTLDNPTSGLIQLGQDNIVGMPDKQVAAIRNRQIGFVFQFHHLLPEFNALENVMMPGLIQGMKRDVLAPRAHKLLEEVGLGSRATHRPGELSGGEQQRVALARALILEPKLILADEPTGNLDSGTSKTIHDLFFEINKKHGTTIVVVTHNPNLAEMMPRKIVMLDGRIAEDTRPSVSMPPVDEKALERSRRLSSVVPAGFGRRAAAYTLDVLIGTVAGVLIGLGGGKLVAEGFAQAALYGYLSFALGVVGLVLGRALADAAGGGTVGKRLMDLVVTSEELRPLPFLRAVARAVLLVVDGFMFGLVGYLVMSESPTQQTTGDQVARAVVVRRAGLDEDAARLNWLGPALGVLVPVLMSVAAIAIGKVLGWLQ